MYKKIALVLSFIVLLWWLYSSILSVADEGWEGIMDNQEEAIFFVILLVSVFIAFRWEVAGGVLLILVGLAAPFYFNISFAEEIIFLITSSVFPIIIGIFFILTLTDEQKSRVKHYSKTPGISK